MASTDVFAGSIPQVYEDYMVPLIFQPYARDLARRAAERAPRDLLEVAAGTGVVTRALAAALTPQARITATDLNQPMLDRAIARQSADRAITWQQADALDLPFGNQSFDIVVCQFGAMFFPDRVQGYREARRVLRPEGQFLLNVWDKISENAFSEVIEEALATLFPGDRARFLSRVPHSYYDERRIRDDLEAAGFTEIAIEPVSAISRAASARDAAVAFCEGTPLRNEIEAEGPARLAEAVASATEALQQRFGSGAIEGPIRALVITARR